MGLMLASAERDGIFLVAADRHPQTIEVVRTGASAGRGGGRGGARSPTPTGALSGSCCNPGTDGRRTTARWSSACTRPALT
jgi:hypothetical protein